MNRIKKIARKFKNLFIRYIQLGFNNYKGSYIIEKDKIFEYLPLNPVIVDCGAHIGTDTIEFAKISGSKIYAFEPIKNIFNKLQENTKPYPNVTCFNLALGSCNGVDNMYVSNGYSDGSSSLLKPKKHLEVHPDVYFQEMETVKISKIDTWAKENKVFSVDMLWLDMQGAEQQMLMESKYILDTVKIIHTEVSLIEIYEGMGKYKGFKKFLEKNGFKAVIEAIPVDNYGGNCLFVKKSLVK
jgi:FkbM family methyltransferase